MKQKRPVLRSDKFICFVLARQARWIGWLQLFMAYWQFGISVELGRNGYLTRRFLGGTRTASSPCALKRIEFGGVE